MSCESKKKRGLIDLNLLLMCLPVDSLDISFRLFCMRMLEHVTIVPSSEMINARCSGSEDTYAYFRVCCVVLSHPLGKMVAECSASDVRDAASVGSRSEAGVIDFETAASVGSGVDRHEVRVI